MESSPLSDWRGGIEGVYGDVRTLRTSANRPSAVPADGLDEIRETRPPPRRMSLSVTDEPAPQTQHWPAQEEAR
ncbi:hypothetical protein [Streptomyces sp. V4I2]|uniref:hypothetical protein n=1 Tax=Streptomyces sp. V4I2 TaxID=3042280 RepID=UPI0027861274|nr:hypothetical protein [Streptomyces sp. V4I2]MDQ1045313.1 hypothetical protein [Streptomyces sp. V4I2]